MFDAARVLIESGGTVSTEHDMFAAFLVGVETPAAWTAANLTFEGRRQDGEWLPVYGPDGDVVTVVADAGRIVLVDPSWFMCCKDVRVVSTVAQGAERVLWLLQRDDR